MKNLTGALPKTDARAPLKFSTRKKEVKTYRVRAYHDGCGGELVGTERVTAVVTMIGASPCEHRCDKCGAIGWVSGVNYPTLTRGKS